MCARGGVQRCDVGGHPQDAVRCGGLAAHGGRVCAGLWREGEHGDDEALGQPMFLPRITEMDGRSGLFVEVTGGVEGFKHQIICVLLRMISEVLNICEEVLKNYAEVRN